MRVVLAKEPWLNDPLSIRKKWNEEEYQLVGHGGGKQMCFGILWNNGEVVPHPPVIRGLEITRQALINAGHKGWFLFLYIFPYCISHRILLPAVIDWTPLKHPEMCSTLVNLSRYKINITRIDSFIFTT